MRDVKLIPKCDPKIQARTFLAIGMAVRSFNEAMG
jgi:hypothetical protein